ncbi:MULTISPECIES: ATP-binding protein [Streptomyces]|uniref:ATP-binding protein n=1 Tax=Streptomyces TaxID=1883 RepID=UPI0004C7DEB9|nr:MULTISPECIES: ATP-binding protein [Streptomyces]RPK85412.1 Histidine kinase-, DNA gyrase B-, and HSP90-like ATPase [Streptomyces sp. ADI98-10]
MAEQSETHEASLRLARRRSSVPRARALLRAKLGEWRAVQAPTDVGELLLSELVTNALRVAVPGDRMIGVRIVCRERGASLRLEVSDAGRGRPRVRWPGELETGGRGLLIVDALAFCWGVKERPAGIGKTIWAEVVTPAVVPVPTMVGHSVMS